MSSLHARFAGLTLLLLILWGITAVRMRERQADLIPAIEIAVEHSEAAGISLIRTTDGRGPVEIRNDADETMYVSLPEAWTRDEVRGAPVTSVKGEEAHLGFRRWTVPARTTVAFLNAGQWNKLTVRNVSKALLRLRTVNIDLAHGTSTTESHLIGDQALLEFKN